MGTLVAPLGSRVRIDVLEPTYRQMVASADGFSVPTRETTLEWAETQRAPHDVRLAFFNSLDFTRHIVDNVLLT
jgi:hypothetical protein